MDDYTKSLEVYILQCGEYTKVGVSKDVVRRIADLSTGAPEPLTLVATLQSDDARSLERAIHDQLHEFHTHGEWFKVDREVIEAIIDSPPQLQINSERKPRSQRSPSTDVFRQELVKCGKSRCRKCQRGASHGPYWYRYYRDSSTKKLKSRYVGKLLSSPSDIPLF